MTGAFLGFFLVFLPLIMILLMVGAFFLAVILLFLYLLLNYIFESISIMNISKNLKYNNKLFAWIPFYNKYYVDELCDKFPDNELCDKWRLVDLTYEEFAKKIEHDRIVEGGFDDQVDNIKTFKDYFVEIVSFLDEYKFFIFGSVIILSSLGIVYLKSLKKKDNFDLK